MLVPDDSYAVYLIELDYEDVPDMYKTWWLSKCKKKSTVSIDLEDWLWHHRSLSHIPYPYTN